MRRRVRWSLTSNVFRGQRDAIDRDQQAGIAAVSSRGRGRASRSAEQIEATLGVFPSRDRPRHSPRVVMYQRSRAGLPIPLGAGTSFPKSHGHHRKCDRAVEVTVPATFHIVGNRLWRVQGGRFSVSIRKSCGRVAGAGYSSRRSCLCCAEGDCACRRRGATRVGRAEVRPRARGALPGTVFRLARSSRRASR
jgi:hypothetical protein